MNPYENSQGSEYAKLTAKVHKFEEEANQQIIWSENPKPADVPSPKAVTKGYYQESAQA